MPLKIRITGIKDKPLTTIEVLATRFIIQTDGCWEWVGYRSSAGYGVFIGRAAHRVVWELVGNTPDLTKQLDHLCRNRACVNPRHLEEVDARTNTMRGFGPSRFNSNKTHCLNGHAFSGRNLAIKVDRRYRTKVRVCKPCQAQHAQNYRDKQHVLAGRLTKGGS
jgi:hypothetical protein